MINREYHVHTNLCDGENTPEEMVLSAINKGFATLGFSGHSPLGDESWCMSKENAEKYRREIKRLKDKYSSQIEILCGIEQDYYSEEAVGYDYIIGSVHCLETEDGLAPMDETAELLSHAVEKYFGGDPLALAERYFETVADVADKTGAQIVGHFDLIQKFKEQSPIFDDSDPRYIKAAESAIEKLSEQNVLFEVNTGATARGYRKEPYPSESLLKKIRDCGADVIITGDCHDMRYLGHGFEDALELIRRCGFKRIAYLTKGKIEYTDI